MSNKPPSDTSGNSAKRAAILKELESVKALLNEDIGDEPDVPVIQEKVAEPEGDADKQQEFQIPLLDPSRSTTFELDFSKPKPVPQKVEAKPEPSPEDIPMVDDITASGSLFSDEDDEDEQEFSKAGASKLTQAQLQSHAQLVIQDLLNEALSEIEDKLDEWIPRLEEKLKKRLEKAMNQFIEDSLKK